jgi:DHA1 family tetracycline resistance protein-like MFS transporter
LAALLAFFILKEPDRASTGPRPATPLTERWFGPISAALARPGLAGLVVVFFLVVFAFSGLETTFALWAERQLSWGPREVGYMFAGVGVVAVIVQGGLIGPLTRRLGEDRVLLTGVVALAAGFVLLPTAENLPAVMLAMALLAAGFGLANPSLHSLVSRRSDASRQGTALGVAQSAASLARIFGPVAAGLFFTVGGRAMPYFASAAILIMVGIVLWRRDSLSSQNNP